MIKKSCIDDVVIILICFVGLSVSAPTKSEINVLKFKGPTNGRQVKVVEAFKHSWNGYKKYAFGHDMLKPNTKEYEDWIGVGLTIIDSLDTMYIMNLMEEFEDGKHWVESELNFDKDSFANLFEITIRLLGGLLSAYNFSGDQVFLSKAIELGDRLLPAFDSPSGIPFSYVNLQNRETQQSGWSGYSFLSDVGSVQLEFRELSRKSGNPIYENVTHRVNQILHNSGKVDGLSFTYIDPYSGQFLESSTISIGPRGDSYYEYLLKQWIQTGKQPNDSLIEDYKNAINGIQTRLVGRTLNGNFTFIAELEDSWNWIGSMHHLVCFLPGTLMLGYKNGMPEFHHQLAKELLRTCYEMYARQPTFLAPDVCGFGDDIDNWSDTNHLRPEFIESLFYFYAITGNKTYQDMGWRIFEAFDNYTRIESGGYTTIVNVKNPSDAGADNKMESFWMAETLKYFYLLFSDNRNEIDVNKFVFNTEAHPLPVYDNK